MTTPETTLPDSGKGEGVSHRHTPGPWVMDEVRTASGRAYRIGSGEMLTAGKGCCIIYDDYGHGENARKANARLIAAAPELLQLVKAFVQQEVEYMTINNLGDPEKQHNVKWARAVLAKAESHPPQQAD